MVIGVPSDNRCGLPTTPSRLSPAVEKPAGFSVDLPEKSAGFQTHLAKLFVFQGKSFQFILLSVYYMNMYGRILKDDDHCRQSSSIVAWQMDFQSSNAYV
jgi:hypothetical protein